MHKTESGYTAEEKARAQEQVTSIPKLEGVVRISNQDTETLTAKESEARSDEFNYKSYNLNQVNFFNKRLEDDKLLKARQKISGAESLAEGETPLEREDVLYAEFRKRQELLFSEYDELQDDPELFESELSILRDAELKYLSVSTKPGKSPHDDLISAFLVDLKYKGHIDEIDPEFRKTIEPLKDRIIANPHSSLTSEDLERRIINAKKYNEENYGEKIAEDYELSKLIGKATKLTEAFIDRFSSSIQEGLDTETSLAFYDAGKEEVYSDMESLKDSLIGNLPWLCTAGYEGNTPEDEYSNWMDSDRGLFSSFYSDSNYANKEINDAIEELSAFMQKYDLDKLDNTNKQK